MQGRNRRVLLTQRDLEILQFIWKWKVISTAVILHMFFPNNNGANPVYRRLERLRCAGYLELLFLPPRRFLWTLGKIGFDQIKENLPVDADAGFRSESLDHDHLTTSVHIGHWAQALSGVRVFSEQQLRRLPMSHYPDWVPRTKVHRPDGYWQISIKGEPATIALEVELTQKNDEDYEVLARFYEENQQVFRIIWVTKNLALAKLIQQKIQKKIPSNYLIHNFVTRGDFETKGWLASFSLGFEQGKPMAFLLDRRITESSHNIVTPLNLDARKYPYNSSTSHKNPKQPVSDRLVLRTSSLLTNFNPKSSRNSIKSIHPSVTQDSQKLSSL